MDGASLGLGLDIGDSDVDARGGDGLGRLVKGEWDAGRDWGFGVEAGSDPEPELDSDSESESESESVSDSEGESSVSAVSILSLLVL